MRPQLRPLSSEEETALTALWKQGRTHLERVRAQFVLLAARYGVSESCRVLGLARSTGQRVLHRFAEGGVSSLHNPPRSGRPPRCTPDDEQFVLGLLQTSPRERGYASNTWTCARIARCLQEERGVRMQPDGVRDLLHRLNTRQVRPNHYFARADEQEKKGRCAA